MEDESSSADLTTEVALLKKLDNGDSWWYIAMSDDEGKTEYEGLLDSQQRVKRIRYKEDGEIEEYVFPVPTNPTENSSSLGGLGMVGLGVTIPNMAARSQQSVTTRSLQEQPVSTLPESSDTSCSLAIAVR